MGKFRITPSGPLKGKIKIQGSKNAALPIMAAAALHDGFTIIKNCPRIKDVDNMALLLTDLGCRVFWQNQMLVIDAKDINKTVLNENISSKFRASILLLGAMVGRCNNVTVYTPGGCKIGARPIDLHIKAMTELGVLVDVKDNVLKAACDKLVAGNIIFSQKSVGATQNAILAAVFAKGKTVIKNASKEPEVKALIDALVIMGADIDITHFEDNIIEINGVSQLYDSVVEVVPDRIVLGTYMGAVLLCGGTVLFENCDIKLTRGYLDILVGMGLKVSEDENGGLLATADTRIQAIRLIKTGPYPEFPTDLQSVIMGLLSVAQGKSTLVEKVFENRLSMAKVLNDMGADIIVNNEYAYIRGVEKLRAVTAKTTDLRMAAALIIICLIATDESIIEDEYIFRGYEDIVGDLNKLGAKVLYDEAEAT